MQLNQVDAGALDGVMQRHRGVGIGPGIQNDAGQPAARLQPPGLVQPVHQFTLVIALAKIKREAVTGTGLRAQFFHIRQGVRAIHRRFTRTQQIEVGAIEDQCGFHQTVSMSLWKGTELALQGRIIGAPAAAVARGLTAAPAPASPPGHGGRMLQPPDLEGTRQCHEADNK